MLSGTDTETALQVIAARAAALTGAGWTLIALPTDPDRTTGEPDDLTVGVSVGPAADLIRGHRIPLTESTTGAAFSDHVRGTSPAWRSIVAAGLGVNFGPAWRCPLGADENLSGVLLDGA